jgi:hypothetical protein
MFKHNNNPITSEAAPWRPGHKPGRTWLAALVLGFAPLATHAGGGSSYTHAEISVGFPNGQITFGKTWEEGDRHVTVVSTSDDDCKREEETEVIIEKREAPPKVVIIEKREPEVVVIERRVAPPPRVIVVREEPRYVREVRYVEPRCERVTYVRPSHHHSQRTHVVRGGRDHHRVTRVVGHHRSVEVAPSRPHNRDLFASDNGHRPRRERGVQHR